MIKYFKTILFVSLAIIFTSAVYSDGASFDSSDNILLIPVISMDDRFVVNGRLKLDANGRFVVEDFVKLSEIADFFCTAEET